MTEQSPVTDDQIKYDELRRVLKAAASFSIEANPKELPSKFKKVVNKVIALINHTPPLFSGLTTSDIIQYYNLCIDLQKVLPSEDSHARKDAQELINRATGIALDLAHTAANKEQKSIKAFLEEALTEMHLETEKIENKLNTLKEDLANHINTFTSMKLDVEHAKAVATTEIMSLLENFRTTAAEKGQDLVLIDYRDGAKQEKRQSDFYRRMAIGFMSISVAVVLYTLLTNTPSDLLSATSITKLFASILLGIPAAYFARESSRHRKQQYLYQQYSFNLNALGPFLADFDKPHKEELKAELARKLFTASHDTGLKDDSYPINIQEILMLLINRLDTTTVRTKRKPTESDD
jgi:hypothetical protein